MKDDMKVWRSIFKKWMKKKRLWSEYLRENENRSNHRDEFKDFEKIKNYREFVNFAFDWGGTNKNSSFWEDLYAEWYDYHLSIKIIPDTRLARKLYTIIAEDSGKLLVENHV